MKSERKRILFYELLLVFASFLWGSNFVPQKIVAPYIEPYTYLTVRSFLGSVVVFIYVTIQKIIDKKKNNPITYFNKAEFPFLLKRGFVCGIITITGSVLVQMGLRYTSAGKTGFLNSLYIIFVPVIGVIFFKQKSNSRMWASIFVATIGLFFLCIKEKFAIEPGDLIVISSTLFFAVHILLLSRFVHEVDGKLLTCVEFVCAAVYCGIFAFVFETPSLELLFKYKYEVLYSGVLTAGIGYMLQAIAQKYVNPTVAGLLLSLEAVFGAAAGALFLGERFTLKEFIGVALIGVGIVFAQLPSKMSEAVENKVTEES